VKSASLLDAAESECNSTPATLAYSPTRLCTLPSMRHIATAPSVAVYSAVNQLVMRSSPNLLNVQTTAAILLLVDARRCGNSIIKAICPSDSIASLELHFTSPTV